MFDHRLRPLKDQILAPLVRVVGARVHPNVLSAVAAFFGIGAAAALSVGAYGAAAGLWVLNRIIDGLDGAVARATGALSDFGGYLDLMLDVVVYSAIPIGFALHHRDPAVLLATAVLLAACYVNITSWLYLSVLFERHRVAPPVGAAGSGGRDARAGRRTSIEMPRGLVEGAETIIAYLLVMLMPRYAVTIFWVTAVAILFGAGQRAVWAYRRSDFVTKRATHRGRGRQGP